MKRSILTGKNQIVVSPLASSTQSRTTVELTGMALDKKLREKRSSAYCEIVSQLDVAHAQLGRQQVDQLINQLIIEFPDLQPYQFPIGIVSKCYLGDPYEVHTLDVRLEIVEHYKKQQSLPTMLEKGRALACHSAYRFVEVYSDSLCAVDQYGCVSIIKG